MRYILKREDHPEFECNILTPDVDMSINPDSRNYYRILQNRFWIAVQTLQESIDEKKVQ